jgi:hypothetical protein
MKMMFVLGGMAVAAGLVGAAQFIETGSPVTKAAAYPPQNCFYTRDIRGHTIASPHTIYLNIDDRQVWQIETNNNCGAGAIPTDTLIIHNNPAGISICKPIDFDVGVAMGGFNNRCIIKSMTLLTKQQVDAIPKKLRP